MISILCPSRGRPDLLERMALSAMKTGTGNHEILVRIDDDDSARDDYHALAHTLPNTSIAEGPTGRVGAMWNELARYADGDILAMGNDDLVYMTNGWDTLRETGDLPADDIFVAWFNDGSPKAGERCAFPLVSRKWYETLGYFTPECFHFLWHDTWIGDLGRLVDRLIYFPDILVEHRHFTFDKARFDRTYKRHRVGQEQKNNRIEDQQTFIKKSKERQAHANLLREVMDTEYAP